MNAAALVCPHCGKRRPDGEVGLAGKALSPEEVRALIAIHGADDAPAEGLLPTLIFPHPSTHGTARAIELVCTVVALPMVILGAVTVGLSRRRARRSAQETSGELTPVLAASGLGGLGLYSLLSFAGVATASALVIIGVSIVALVTRGAIRAHASSRRSRELHRLARPEPAPRSPRATAPATAVAPRLAAPSPSASDAPRATTGDPDEPSLLK